MLLFFQIYNITCGSICSIWPGNTPGRQSSKYYRKAKRIAWSTGAETLPAKCAVSFNTDSPHCRFRFIKMQTPLGGRNPVPAELIMTFQQSFHRLILMKEKCMGSRQDVYFIFLGSGGFLFSPPFPIP